MTSYEAENNGWKEHQKNTLHEFQMKVIQVQNEVVLRVL